MDTIKVASTSADSQAADVNYTPKPDVSKLLALSRSLAGRRGPFFSKYQLMPLPSTTDEYGLLGEGGFSVCFRCINRHAGGEYAVKIIRRPQCNDESKMPSKLVNNVNNALHREIAMLKRCQGHPNIVKLEEVITDAEYMYVVLEFLSGGSLGHRLWERDSPLPLEKAKAVFKQLASALVFMHSKDIVHRDLKPDNVIFVNASSDLVKIVDFGLACKLVGDKLMSTPRCTFNYAAPEILYQFIVRHEPTLLKAENAQLYRTDAYDSSCDLWALGVTLFQMLTGKPPFHTIKGRNKLAFHANTILEKMVAGRGEGGKFTQSVQSAEADELLAGLLTLHSANRMTIEQLKVHPWMVAESEEEMRNPAKRTRRLDATMADQPVVDAED